MKDANLFTITSIKLIWCFGYPFEDSHSVLENLLISFWLWDTEIQCCEEFHFLSVRSQHIQTVRVDFLTKICYLQLSSRSVLSAFISIIDFVSFLSALQARCNFNSSASTGFPKYTKMKKASYFLVNINFTENKFIIYLKKSHLRDYPLFSFWLLRHNDQETLKAFDTVHHVLHR